MLLDAIEVIGEPISPPPLDLLRASLFPDPGDLPIAEVAVAANVEALVTGNLRHFPPGAVDPVLVLSPREALTWLSK